MEINFWQYWPVGLYGLIVGITFWGAHKIKNFSMDSKPLTKQTLFWLAIIVPVFSFFYFGAFSWNGCIFQFDMAGFKKFIEISALPLGLLSLSIPFTSVVNNIHRTIQTNKQIETVDSKNRIDLFYAHQKYFIDYIRSIIPPLSIKEYKFNIYNNNESRGKERKIITVMTNVNIGVANYFKFYSFLFCDIPKNSESYKISKLNISRIVNIINSIDDKLRDFFYGEHDALYYRCRIGIMYDLNIELNNLFDMVGICNNSELLYNKDSCPDINDIGHYNYFFREENNASYIRIKYECGNDKGELITNIYSDKMYYILLARFIGILNNALQFSEYEPIDIHYYKNIANLFYTNNINFPHLKTIFSVIGQDNNNYKCFTSGENKVRLEDIDVH